MLSAQQRRAVETAANDLAPEFQAALDHLAQAAAYAHDAGVDPWEFAVEIERLTALDLTWNDLRWLVAQGYVEHACEVTRPSDDSRRFVSPRNLAFRRRTCFVLADCAPPRERPEHGGPGILRFPSPTRGRAQGTVPRWDGKLRALCFDDQVVKRFRVPSLTQERVLTAFQEEGWPEWIADPLPPEPGQDAKRRLNDTIKRLNDNQQVQLIRFRGDGTGQGVLWEAVASQPIAVDDCPPLQLRRAA